MKYIFVAGAPGSKWSSVVKNIYYSSDINRSDYRDEWTYYHDASGTNQLMHLGAYFDPGMDCNLPKNFYQLDKLQLEKIFDQPFLKNSQGIKIIKSHIFSNHIDFLRNTFPDIPIVLVHRDDDSCLGWWVKCGHFEITYPKYDYFYKDLRTMSFIIKEQNAGILKAWNNYQGIESTTSQDLANILKINLPPTEYHQDYAANGIRVKVI